ncbi:MAG: DUF1553 domain-containing protein [Planctomycetes bacterium]|nr:DUF1553 domain-containing protein [Planctomycetota bacterium]
MAFAWFALAVLGAASSGDARAPEFDRPDFDLEVRPILSDRCFPCHGPDAGSRKAKLRLDVRDEALAPRAPGAHAPQADDASARRAGGARAIVPGDPAASELVARIHAESPDDVMPPPDSGRKPLSEAEKATLERWIASGADYAPHWAFVPPTRAMPPAVADVAWCRDELDRWVLAELERRGVAPAPEADRETWLRRVAFDLTGLPPSPVEVATFVADARPEAYELVVDRLLASPRYAERMAADWLDLARYADTYGYQADAERRVWPYRDWVIRAFDQDLPYDRFATWQLAGDLVRDAAPAETPRDAELATAFNRLHRQTNEGGSTEEEFRVEYVADRVHTFGTAFLGLTTECARCHDHKYDPLPQRDYYGLFAYFDDGDESGLYSYFTSATPTPTLRLTTPEQETRLAELAREVAGAEARVAGLASERESDFQAWLASGSTWMPPGPIARYPLDAYAPDGSLANAVDPTKPGATLERPKLVEGRVGGALEFSGDDNASFPGVAEFEHTDPFSFALWLWTPAPKPRAVVLKRSRAWSDAGSQGYELLLDDSRLTWSLIHFWPGNAISIRTRERVEPQRWTHVAVTYDGSARASGLAIHVDGALAEVEVVRDGLWKPITGGEPGALTLAERFRDVGFAGGRVDELCVFDRCLTALEVAALAMRTLGSAPHSSSAPRAPRGLGIDALRETWLACVDEPARAAREALRAARKRQADELARVEELMTMRDRPTPRTAFVLKRGRYDQPDTTQPVEPHVPTALGGVDGLPPNRLGLARWLVAPSNPLFGRVAVNRMWAQCFGEGLVATRENFGLQGEAPSHPELLDALAVRFAEDGWSTKRFLRRLVLSATYRQSSRARAELATVDPENRLLARGSVRRLSAEELRDQALCASGLLVERVGGPSVKPWQPPGIWEIGWGGTYTPDTGEGLHRRSLYTYWRRTAPPPSMLLFDASKREVCVARRSTTNTPLQALVLFDDPQFVECARSLAAVALRESTDSAARVERVFRGLATRAPEPAERAALAELFESELASFRADPAAAERLLAGASDVDGLARDELAALTLVASTVLASDASQTRR